MRKRKRERERDNQVIGEMIKQSLAPTETLRNPMAVYTAADALGNSVCCAVLSFSCFAGRELTEIHHESLKKGIYAQ